MTFAARHNPEEITMIPAEENPSGAETPQPTDAPITQEPQLDPNAPKGTPENPLSDADAQADLEDTPRPTTTPTSEPQGDGTIGTDPPPDSPPPGNGAAPEPDGIETIDGVDKDTQGTSVQEPQAENVIAPGDEPKPPVVTPMPVSAPASEAIPADSADVYRQSHALNTERYLNKQ